MFENWRFNPFTGTTNSVEIENESHTIAYHSDWNGYGIQLNEAPKLEVPSSIEIIEDITGGSTFTEIPRTQSPSSGEFRVDYDADGYYGTGRIEFNAGDIGKNVLVTYKGNGWIVKNDYRLGQTVIPADLEVTGAAIFDSIVEFLDSVSGEVVFNDDVEFQGNVDFSSPSATINFDGSVEFNQIPTLPDSDPISDNDIARKKYVDDIDDNLKEQIKFLSYSSFFPVQAFPDMGIVP